MSGQPAEALDDLDAHIVAIAEGVLLAGDLSELQRLLAAGTVSMSDARLVVRTLTEYDAGWMAGAVLELLAQ